MLQLVLGPSGSGKTHTLYTRILERARAGKRSILLVPEQFTSSTEGRLYRLLGDELSGFVTSYSFTSLAEALLQRYGGAAVRTLDDAGRAVLIRRAVASLGDEIVCFGRHKRSAAFCQMAADTIRELKNAGLDGPRFLEIARRLGPGNEKLQELGLIFTAYEALLARSAMDPEDRVDTAARRLEPDFFAGQAVFVDEFDAFNASKYRLLEAILPAAEEMTVALCADGLADPEQGLGLFSRAKRVAALLLDAARRREVRCAAPVVLTGDERHKTAPGLARLGQLLWQGDCEELGAPEITLSSYPGPQQEAAAVAAAVQKLARQGIPYRKMAVICRTAEDYLPAVRYAFRLADIPLFCDEAVTAEHSAPALMVRAALGLARRGLASEPLLALVKSGLCDLPEEACCALENYAYTWQLRAADWRAPFTCSPEGFGGRLDGEAARQLELAEQARAFVVGAAERFLQRIKGDTNAAALSRAVWLLLDSLGAPRRLAQLAEELRAQQGEGYLAAADAVREWNTVCALLDQMDRLVGEDELTPAEYDELFGLLLRATDLGRIPQTLDAVILTTARRMGLEDADYCFVVGLGEGQFPQAPGGAGLLTHADRDALIGQGVEMLDSFENRVMGEQGYFYKAITAAGKGLWLSWCEGAAGTPLTSALSAAVKRLHPAPPDLTPADYAPTPDAALDALGQTWQQAGGPAPALRQALAARPEMAPALAAMERAAHPEDFAAQDTDALARLLGPSLRISPSRMERYYTCRFAYFMEYVLKVKPRKKAELSADQTGTLVHFVLEQAPRRSGPGFVDLTVDQLAALAHTLTEEYVQANMPGLTTRMEYLIARLEDNVAALLAYLQEEQRQGAFTPAAFELSIGMGADAVPPVTLTTPEGQTIQVIGQIDRVDTFTKDGHTYLRVVDYKTGTKTFSLDAVYNGLNCQMLIYLFTLTRQGAFASPEPAGVSYILADPAPLSGTRQEAADTQPYQVDGLVLQDDAVILAMDSGATGRFVPFTFNEKTGKPRATKKLASLEKLGRIQQHIDGLLVEMARGLYSGRIEAEAHYKGDRPPCRWCDYRAVCGHEEGRREVPVQAPDKVFEEVSEE